MAHERRENLIRFYSILDDLERRVGERSLANCSGRMNWPRRGVYFFREPDENRTDTGSGPRVVRVGTHALKSGSRTTLWTRLSQHKGQVTSGGGNHRGSIFRLIVGTALIERDGYDCLSWGADNSARRDVKTAEYAHECNVSAAIRKLPFLWVAVDDDPGPGSLRGYIEKNSIALLSNFSRTPLDPPSTDWLGHYCNRERVKKSGLWNSNHVDEDYDPSFLDELSGAVSAMRSSSS